MESGGGALARAGAVAKLRLGDFQDDGAQYVLRFQEKGGKSEEQTNEHVEKLKSDKRYKRDVY